MTHAEQHPTPDAANDLRERLAALCHTQWSGWMQYLFRKSALQINGDVTIPKWAIDRWTRQSKTDYAQLSPDEQDNDREEADRFLALIQPKAVPDAAMIERVRGCANAAGAVYPGFESDLLVLCDAYEIVTRERNDALRVQIDGTGGSESNPGESFGTDEAKNRLRRIKSRSTPASQPDPNCNACGGVGEISSTDGLGGQSARVCRCVQPNPAPAKSTSFPGIVCGWHDRYDCAECFSLEEEIDWESRSTGWW